MKKPGKKKPGMEKVRLEKAIITLCVFFCLSLLNTPGISESGTSGYLLS